MHSFLRGMKSSRNAWILTGNAWSSAMHWCMISCDAWILTRDAWYSWCIDSRCMVFRDVLILTRDAWIFNCDAWSSTMHKYWLAMHCLPRCMDIDSRCMKNHIASNNDKGKRIQNSVLIDDKITEPFGYCIISYLMLWCKWRPLRKP